MSGDEFLEKMELIDPAFVTAAAEPSRQKERRSVWVRWGAVAACLCAVAAIAFAALRPIGQQPDGPHLATAAPTTEATSAPTEATEEPTEKATEATTEHQLDSVSLQTITVPDLYAGFGYEGFTVYDLTEYRRSNPWSPDMELTTLPVYRNGAYDPSLAGVPLGLNEEEMIAQLQTLAEQIGLEIDACETQWENVYVDRKSSERRLTATGVEASTNNGTLTVWASGGFRYAPAKNLTLFPAGSRFSYHDSTDGEAQAALDYLITAYADVLVFEAPTSAIPVAYTFQGLPYRSYEVYDAAGTSEEVILNYNLRWAEFLPDEYTEELAVESPAGALLLIRVHDALLTSEKLGDYPIITADEAKELLLSGHGQSSVPAEYPAPTAETVEHVELVYRTGAREEFLLPYYRFDVRLPDEPSCGSELGLKNYGVYYVPAVAAEYLTDMPTYDGWFIG